MTHREIGFFARVDDSQLAPGLALVLAHLVLSFLSNGVLCALVVADRSVEFALVPTESDTVQKRVAVRLLIPLLDDVKGDASQGGNVGGGWQGSRLVPERNGLREIGDLVSRHNGCVECCHFLRLQWPIEKHHVI